ncbi:MAG TPA: VWA domain-containing protein [Acidimicrobiia bacterium]|jgi:hypothetical protein|nr:VWA domain-containing protein [Acidimicrobiia bacterium]
MTAFADNLVLFVRYLRGLGFRLPPQSAGELSRAAVAVGLERRDDVYHAFRSIIVIRPSEVPLFDEAFDLFFGMGAAVSPAPAISTTQAVSTTSGLSVVPSGAVGPDFEDVADRTGASSAERLGRRDFGEMSAAESEEVRRLIAKMVWRPADARSRRYAPARIGSQPDLRRTLRGAVGTEGELLRLAMSERRRRRRPLIVIADVSGSMERYVEMLLYFAHAARDRLGHLEAFVFSTRLTRITRQLRRRDPGQALEEVAGHVVDWSGGTRIGEALHAFNVEWSRRVGRGGPVALIVSDGWDRGDPELLREEMARFARSVHRVVWLNPLAGREGYAPETRGMRTVLPYVDDLLPAANLTHLADVIRLLESLPARRREVARP